jgi:hypothetical protein
MRKATPLTRRKPSNATSSIAKKAITTIKGSESFSYDYYPQLKESYRSLTSALLKISSGRATAFEALDAIKDNMNAEIDTNINGIEK